MSIRDLIREWENSGQLAVVPPALPSIASLRYVIATAEVRNRLCGTWADQTMGVRYARARTVVDAFTQGLAIATRLPPSTSARAQLALLSEAREEIWEFRSRDPKPGVRVFGRFAEKDVFLALWTELKENIDEDYTDEKEKCKKVWRKLFYPFKPFTPELGGEYLTGAVYL